MGRARDEEAEAERRRKISEAARGKPKSPETRAKISKAMTGTRRGPLTEETRRKMSASHFGKSRSEEVRERISKSAKERWEKLGPEYRNKYRPHARAVLQLDMDGTIVHEWECVSDILKDPRFSSRYRLQKCLNGRESSYAGYQWQYRDPK